MGYQLYYSEENLVLKDYMPSNRMNLNYPARMYEGFGRVYAQLNTSGFVKQRNF
jgi:hypothetical protein